MSPGEQELGNEPFVGPSGYMVWWAANQCGFTRADCSVLNVCNCWPIGNRGKTLSPGQVAACWQRVEDELEAAQPLVILCLGSDALKRITGLTSLDAVHGKHKRHPGSRGYLISPSELPYRKALIQVGAVWKTSRKDEHGNWLYRKGDPRTVTEYAMVPAKLPASVRYIVATYHPSYVMKKRKRIMRALVQDMDRAWRAALGVAEPFQENIVYSTQPKGLFFPEPYTDLTDDGLAFDIETVGTDGPIYRIGFASQAGCWTAPWNQWTKEESAKLLSDPRFVKVAHNSQFDISRLKQVGVEVVPPLWDTMVVGMMLEPDLPKGLASMAPLYIDLRRWKHLSESSLIGDQERYNAYDAAIEYKLFTIQRQVIRQHGMLRLTTETIMPALAGLNRMSENGIPIDAERLATWKNKLWSELQNALYQWRKLVPDVDPLKTQKLVNFLYYKLKLPKQFDIEGNSLSTEAAAIKRLIAECPEHKEMLERLLRVRFVNKRLTTYAAIKPGTDGLVHPRFLPIGKDDVHSENKRKGNTATGRLSAVDPPIQQIDKKDPDTRRIFLASLEPDWEFTEVDLKQGEVHAVAYASGDRQLIYDLTHGVDIHGELSLLVNIPRPAGKQGFFLTIYGGGAPKLAKAWRANGILLGERVASDFQERGIRRRYPHLMAFLDRTVVQGTEDGYITNHFGRRRWFWQAGKDAPAMKDFFPQSDIADVMWDRLLAMESAVLPHGGLLCAQIHDSFLARHHKSVRQEIRQAMVATIEDRVYDNIGPGCRFPVSVKQGGPTWQDITEV